MFTLSIQSDIEPRLTGLVRALESGLTNRPAMHQAIGRAAAELTRGHMYTLANERHRPGVSPNFYQDAGDAVTHRDIGDAVEIRVDKTGIAQRFYGGRIAAVNTSHLWIPIPGSRAEGRAPREFPDLVPIISPLTNKGVAFQKGREDDILFALVEEVSQAADPTVLPSEDQYRDAAEDAVNQLIDRIEQRR